MDADEQAALALSSQHTHSAAHLALPPTCLVINASFAAASQPHTMQQLTLPSLPPPSQRAPPAVQQPAQLKIDNMNAHLRNSVIGFTAASRLFSLLTTSTRRWRRLSGTC